MNSSNRKSKLTSALKWILFAVCALVGLKVFVAVATFLSTGLALATLALWGLGAVAVTGGALFIGFKMLAQKNK